MKNFPKIDELQLKLLEKSIDNVEREIIKLDSKSDEIIKRLSIKEKLGLIETMGRDTITNIKPTINITGMPFYINYDHINYTYSIENKRKYTVIMEKPKLFLSTTKIDNTDKIKNQLILGKDYCNNIDNRGIDYINPGEVVSNKIIIQLLNPNNIPKTIYYKIIFTANTEPSVIKSVKNINQKDVYDQKIIEFIGDIIRSE